MIEYRYLMMDWFYKMGHKCFSTIVPCWLHKICHAYWIVLWSLFETSLVLIFSDERPVPTLISYIVCNQWVTHIMTKHTSNTSMLQAEKLNESGWESKIKKVKFYQVGMKYNYAYSKFPGVLDIYFTETYIASKTCWFCK